MAMVDKQGWFLMSKPHALVSKIFKARYFPKTSYFDASLGYNPSFVWRRFWKAREVLTLGCKWSIGDDSSIKVMNAPWLRDGERKCLTRPQKQGVYNITVNNLMLENVKQWNMRLLRDMFDYTTIEEIIQVSLVEDVTEDRLVWKEEENGCYGVRSGYRMWRNMWRKSLNTDVPIIWSNIWGIKAPSRVKHLLWGIFHGCLPTRARLRQQHVQFPDVKSIFIDICDKEDRNISGRVVVMMDVLWKNRNDFIWNDEKEVVSKLGGWWVSTSGMNGLKRKRRQVLNSGSNTKIY
ncbi:uncharacterized protein LOC131596772 [Vicia villosa]|uniref:uncharacterized protein LOC131596772 n=1 Tax=Vicia villosa TaxID=3911 RepID=UPI00273CBEE8|nr:uncharacterized protein LOC131596772 [Vicia villosa]